MSPRETVCDELRHKFKCSCGPCRAVCSRLQPLETEQLLFQDKKNRLIADELQQRGTVDHTPVYPREVIKRALELGASALILVHNHAPYRGGDA